MKNNKIKRKFKTRGQQIKDDRLARRLAEEYGTDEAKKLMTGWKETGGQKEKKGKPPSVDQHGRIVKGNAARRNKITHI